MRRATVVVLAVLTAVCVLAPAASAEKRLATIVGVSGSIKASFRYEGTPRTDIGPVKDVCVSLHADAEYRFSLARGGEVVELDFGVPGVIRPTIETVRGGTTRVRMRAKATGSAEATAGQYNKFENCVVQTPGWDTGEDGVLTPLTGISPDLCGTATGVFLLDQQGPEFGSMTWVKQGWEDEWLRCGWTTPTQMVPSIMAGTMRGQWARKRVFFRDGAPGTTVAVTYPYTFKPDNPPDCPGSDNDVVVNVCTLTHSGSLTVRYRLGS